jgi:hypothetical protein
VNGGGTGGSGVQEDTNKRNLFVMTKIIDDFGNESFDSASLALEGGLATAVTHACSGGSPTFGGNATAGGYVDFNQIYQLTSSTVPAGTLLPVHFQFASAARIIASGTNLDFFQDSGGSGANVAVSLRTTEFIATTLANVNGAVSRGYSYPDVESLTRGGNYEPDGGHGMVDFMLAVGDSIRLSVAADATAGSTALGNGAIDGDSQLSLVWGFGVTGDAILSTDDSTPVPAPPASNGTPEQALLDLPDRPETTMPEPASLSLLACGSTLRLRRGRRAR